MRYLRQFIRFSPLFNIKCEALARLAYEDHYLDGLKLWSQPKDWHYDPSFIEIQYLLNFSSWLGDALQFLQSNLNDEILADFYVR